ncbi:MAG: glycosyltransferase family 4 protein [Burkholderiaceae bacterium]|nr:glycosyltransferase family 4 protein [Burkholderiaceae bacterium]
MSSERIATPLHLVSRFQEPHAGAELELPDLADALAGRRECRLWSVDDPHPVYVARGVRRLDVQRGDSPVGGMLLLGGVHVALGPWLEDGRFERIAVRYNLPLHERLLRMIARIRHATGLDPELLFVSEVMRSALALPGRIEPSFIALPPYLSIPVARPPGRPFTVGRVSRDVLEKHHPDDVILYRLLASTGAQVRIMGGTCLAPWLDGVEGIELLPAGAEPVAAFNASLDTFYYRTGGMFEPYGRVVFEAMASGLPVVVSRQGGFADGIDDGESGLLFDTQEEAWDALTSLRADPGLRLRMGERARQKAQRLHGDEAVQALLDFYLR